MLCRGPGPQWVVCYTEPKGEQEARDGIGRLGMQGWMMVERVNVVRRGKRVPIDRPFLPRYVFSGLDPHRDDWQRLIDVDGVESVLCNNNSPMFVPSADIARLRHCEDIGLFDRTRTEPVGFDIGDVVRIVGGPFAEISGDAVIEAFVAKLRSTTASKRAKVVFNFLGRMTRIELPVEHIEKI